MTFAWREHPHLKETGVPAPWRLKASETLHIAAGGLVLLAASTMVAGTLGRIAFATVLPVLSYWRLRQLWALPGATGLNWQSASSGTASRCSHGSS